MPIICPDPATLTTWRNAMVLIGGGLLLAAPLLVGLIVRARPAGWVPWLISILSAALGIGVSGTSFILAARLNGAFAQVARWFPGYPTGCAPGDMRWNPENAANIQRLAQQAVEPLEHAAWIDVLAAAVVVAAMGTCALIWGRTRRAALQPLG